MTRVSLATLRLSNPNARITIACDQQTYEALQISDSKLFQETNAIVAFKTSEGTATFRNRFVKTKLGTLIHGPFLFLDSDIVVRRNLNNLLNLNCDIAAAPNHSLNSLEEQIWSEDKEHIEIMGWQTNDPYLNGGVIWYQGNKKSTSFSMMWHLHWLDSVRRTGRLRDQTALNHTLSVQCGLRIGVLPHSMNAQYNCNPSVAQDAHIWHAHWSGSSDKYNSDAFAEIFIKNIESSSRELSIKKIRKLVSRKTPLLNQRRHYLYSLFRKALAAFKLFFPIFKA